MRMVLEYFGNEVIRIKENICGFMGVCCLGANTRL